MGTDDGVETAAPNRWTRVVHHSAAFEDLGLAGALKTYFLVHLPIVLVVLLAVGTFAGALIFQGGSEWEPLRFGTIIAVLGLGVCGFIYDAKRLRPVVQPYAPDVLPLLNSRERRTIRRGIMRGARLESEQLVVARACAVQVRKQAATQLATVVPMLTLLILGQALPNSSSFWMLTLGGALLVVTAAAIAVRQFLLTGRFLKQTDLVANA